MPRTFIVALTGLVLLVSVAARQPQAQTPAQTPTPAVSPAATPHVGPYMGADTCKECHSDYYAAWAKTKHAKALSKLQPADRAGGQCIKCHVTGSPEMIAAEGAEPSFPNVQCEGCHGPGQRHIEAARTGSATDAPTTKVTEDTCLRCHNETSPHYKPFFFNAMKGLVHRR